MFKTIKWNTGRAGISGSIARRNDGEHAPGSRLFRLKKKKQKNKSSSSQAGGPAHKESGPKQG